MGRALPDSGLVNQEGKAMGALGPVVYNELIKELLVSRNPEALPNTKTLTSN